MSTQPVAHSEAFVPVQPTKVEPGLAVAETTAVRPEVYVPAPLTVPEPVPAIVKDRVKVCGLTVSVVLPLIPPEVAVMVVGPGFRPAATPFALIDAPYQGLLLFQTTISGTIPETATGVVLQAITLQI
jgi:hypothetical protein